MWGIKNNPFLRNVSILFVGTVLSQAINIISLPILSRLYGTEEFADLALFSAFGLIVMSFSTLKLDVAIVKYDDIKTRYALFKLAFQSNLIFSILAFAIILLWNLSADWHEMLTNETSFEFVSLLFFYLFFFGSSQCLTSFYNSENKYHPIARSRIILSLTNFLIAVALYFVYPNLGLIWAFTLASGISFLYLAFLFREKISEVFKVGEEQMKKIFKQNKDFIQFTTPATILDVLSVQGIVIFLATTFSEEIVGSYFMALRVIMLPTAFIGAAIGQVFFKDISTKYEQNKLSTNDFWSVWKILILIGIIPFTILFFYGKNIFEFVLGSEWILAGQMASILAIKGFLNFIGSSTSSGFIVLNKQHYDLVLTTIRIIYTFALLFWAASQNDIFTFLWYYAIIEVFFMTIYNYLIIRIIQTKKAS